MSNFLIDPLISADHLRREIYNGGLVIFACLYALNDFVEYAREQLAELFHPYASRLTMATQAKRDQRPRPGAVDHNPPQSLVPFPLANRSASVREVPRRWARPCLSVRILLSQVARVCCGKILLQGRL